MKWFLITLIGVTIIASCKESKSNKLLAGKWQYEKLQNFPGEEGDLQDPRSRRLHESNLGLTYLFTKDETFIVSRAKSNGVVEEISRAKYKLSEDKGYIISIGPEGLTGELYMVE